MINKIPKIEEVTGLPEKHMPVKTPNKSLRSMYTAVALFIMVLLGIIIYSNTFDSPFLFDDEPFIIDDPAVHMTEFSWGHIKTAAMEGFPRQRYLPNISWALNYYFDQLNPFGYHLINLIIHLMSGVFLFSFIKNTLRVYPRDTRDTHPELIAFFAALIWIVQPVGTQAVTYICQRMASMVALFYILSLLLYVRGRMAMREHPPLIPPSRGENGLVLIPVLYFSGSLLAFICAIATKENAGTLPLVILLYEWFFFQDLKLTWSRRQVLWIFFLGIVFAGVVFWYMGENPMHRILNSYNRRDFSLVERVMTEWRIMIYYISLFLWAPPGRLNLDHDYPLSLSPIHPSTTLIACAAIFGLLALAAYSAKKERLLAFCILWFFITQATESTIIGIELFFEHRTYIPFMMTGLLFVLMVFRLVSNRTVAYSLLIAASLIFSVWTYHRNQTWQDPVRFLSDCAAKSPAKSRPQYNLGVLLYDAGNISGAVTQNEKAIRIDPNNANAHNNLGGALLEKGNIEEAIKHFRQAMALDPDLADAYNNLGNALFKQRKINEAIHNFSRALTLNPDHTEAHNNLANALMQKGDIQGAIDRFQIILKKNPDHVEANINMGAVLARMGQIDAAIASYQTALKHAPYNPEAHNNMGVLFVQKNMFAEARAHFQKAIDLRPGYKSAMNNMQRLNAMQK